GLRRDELTTLADIGALNAFTHERRSALWQVERAVRPAGELFTAGENHGGRSATHAEATESVDTTNDLRALRGRGTPPWSETSASPLPPMTPTERLEADYGGMGLTIGPHPMALRRSDMAVRGVLRASDLPQSTDGRRVRVAGMVIT